MIPVSDFDLPFTARKEQEEGCVMQLSAQPNKGLNILKVNYVTWKKSMRTQQALL